MLSNKSSHSNEKPAHKKLESRFSLLQLEKAHMQQKEAQHSQKKKKKKTESSGLTKRSIKTPVSNHTPAKFLWRIQSPIAAKRERIQHNEDLA